MVRSRPELPSDPDPAGRDGEPVGERKRRRKRRREEESDESERAAIAGDAANRSAETEAESVSDEPADAERVSADPERLRREVAAELVFRERVALTELVNRLSPEAYRALERALVGRSAAWKLEKGRYLFTALVGERSVPTDSGEVHVEQRSALSREAPPVDPRRVDELVADAAAAELPSEAELVRNLERLREELPSGDEVRIRPAPELPTIVVTAESVTVEPASGPAEPESSEAEEAIESADRPEPPVSGDERPEPDPAEVGRIIAEIEREPAETPPARPPEPATELPDREVTPKDEAPASTPDLAAALEILDREAVDLNDLPPIRGGAPEADEPDEAALIEADLPPEPPEETPPETPPEAPPEPDLPPPEGPFAPPPERPAPRRSRSRRASRRTREILRWDPGSAEVIRYPDHAMRQKGRKLVRRLAAEYGIKLTPQLEAYLLGIVLQPHLVGGRRVYSLGLNVDTLVSVLHVLKYNFNQTHRPPA